ncbi:MAG: apolipoprotein N-acyltransferase, partial [Pseudomonadota bacterium]
FGEYVPLRKLFFFVDKITTFPSDDMVAGTSFEPFNLGNHKISMLICYEDIFPDISRREVLNGSEILVNLTNDAWYGLSSAAYQHLALAIFRAVENRRYLIRSTNTGVSAIITATGNVVASTGLFEQAILVNQIPFMNDKTLYTRLGDWFAWGMSLYLLIAIIAVMYRKIRK